MVLIKLRNGLDWYKANWVFRQLAEDVVSAFPDDKELELILEKAQAFGTLWLDTSEPNSVNATISAIKKVAEGTVQGTIPGWKKTRPGDTEGQSMYLGAVAELLDLIRMSEEGKA